MSDILTQVIELLRQAAADDWSRIPAADIASSSLIDLGLDSVGILRFLVSVEDAFGIEWPEDLPLDTLDSARAVAGYVAKQLVTAL